ncbi:HAD hydrolase family protein [Conexibacter sp. DBS9H8]|uniref:HAD hydrolase family protein n=1 Tax=Conexibacter sp. DBS9H8 TaxID=2937801 RepID=UPI00200CCEA8|nr:HAD hydrolase family protein [Conexibacter sp. DBS9H8]
MLAALYVDLDGTLLGPGGSLLAAADGGVSLLGVRAVEACLRAGVEVVVVTGRRQASAFEDARLLGGRAYIFELGCGLVLDAELEWLTDGLEPSATAGSIYEQIEASGAPELLLDRYAGALQYHTPWSEGREVSHLLRGQVDVPEANALLAGAGHPHLRLVDNGVLAAHGVNVDGSVLGLSVDRVHAYHLMPAGASKARAVARHMQNRGYAPADCIAVGDSREDMEMAAVVSRFWLVANGAQRDPSLGADAARHPRVRVCEESYGAAVYEAVLSTLAQQRGGATVSL